MLIVMIIVGILVVLAFPQAESLPLQKLMKQDAEAFNHQ